ncbi:EAL domain-containing protein [Jannaschia sp. Os4]|uniref:EAL domain-containing protein n=1 Tax=Jannaschia sp. Os4 TaxID=2807617 RepID=UPI00193997D1|nr:EAL domain-containing protein [Jannaschia sp. Os4]MBM2577231.1 EAL domain-containing protein [Jannaschia sp. Os4]
MKDITPAPELPDDGAPGIDPDAPSPFDYATRSRDRDVLDMVRAALARDDVTLAFQPVVAAGGETAFHESLVRLTDGTGRVIPAAQFIGAVEGLDLGREIDCAALRLALRALRRTPGLRLSVNMSARSIGYGPWRRLLHEGLEGRDAPGERLILEISEPSAMQVPEITLAFMRDLSPRGVSFALDHLGAGMTSFRHLRAFLFDILKIDGSLVAGCDADADAQCLIDIMVSLGTHLDAHVVAQGVERGAEAAVLTRAGVDGMQGWHCGGPSLRPDWTGAA